MKKLFLITSALVVLSTIASAATIAPSYTRSGSGKRITWSNVDIDGGDTVTNSYWQGGCAQIEFDSAGSWTSGTVEVTTSVVSGNEKTIDSDNAPDGLVFSSATSSFALFNLAEGYIIPLYASSGGYAEHDIYITPISDEGC